MSTRTPPQCASANDRGRGITALETALRNLSPSQRASVVAALSSVVKPTETQIPQPSSNASNRIAAPPPAILQDWKLGDVMITQHPEMKSILRKLDAFENSDTPILIEGETGTGKELIAQYVHSHSNRRKGPFIKVNCAAISSTLAESEIFGHKKGAFTGASYNRKGAFEMATNGTLFLDEIAHLSRRVQRMLLRTLQDGVIFPVGEDSIPIQSNARLVCACNCSLASQVMAGKFREDLFYRSVGYKVMLPSLRDRRDDIPALIAHFLKCITPTTSTTFSAEAIDFCIRQTWPGNIRQLRSVVAAAVCLSQSHIVEVSYVVDALAATAMPPVNVGDEPPDANEHPRVATLRRLLAATDHSLPMKLRMNQIASQEGVSVSSIYRFLAEHNLKPKQLVPSGQNS